MYESVEAVVKKTVWELLEVNDKIDILLSKINKFAEPFDICELENGQISFCGSLKAIINGQQLLSSMWREAKYTKIPSKPKKIKDNSLLYDKNAVPTDLPKPKVQHSSIKANDTNLNRKSNRKVDLPCPLKKLKHKTLKLNTITGNSFTTDYQQCSQKGDFTTNNNSFYSDFTSDEKINTIVVTHVVKNNDNYVEDCSFPSVNSSEQVNKDLRNTDDHEFFSNSVNRTNVQDYSSFLNPGTGALEGVNEDALTLSVSHSSKQTKPWKKQLAVIFNDNKNLRASPIHSTKLSKKNVDESINHKQVFKFPAEAKTYNCKMCNFACRLKSEHKRHINKEHPVTYTCSQCTYKTTKKVYYMRHVRNVHENQRPHKCQNCQLSFKRTDALRQHQIVHQKNAYSSTTCPDVPSFLCKICKKNFRSAFYLKEHMLTHSDERSFLCEVCGATFKTRPVYRNHLRVVHLQELKYLCNICCKTFITKFSLKRHKIQHERSSVESNHIDMKSSPQLPVTNIAYSSQIMVDSKGSSAEVFCSVQDTSITSITEERPVIESKTDVSLYADCHQPENFDLCIDDQIPYVIQSTQDVIDE